MSFSKLDTSGEWMVGVTFVLILLRSISSAPVISRNPPIVLTSNPVSVEIDEGKTIKLECPVFSQPQAFISWQKDGSNINQGWMNYRVAGNNLRIRNVTREDEGCFTCLAVNGFGSAEVRIQLKVLSGSRKSEVGGVDTNKTFDHPHEQDLSTINGTTAERLEEEAGSSIRFRGDTTDALVPPQKHRNSSMHSYNLQSQETYILIATGVVFFAIAVCLIVLVVLLHLTYGLPCCVNKSADSKLSPSRSKHPQYPHSKYDDENVSSSVSQLLVSSSLSLENNHISGDPSTWFLLDAATLAKDDRRSGSLKF